MYRVPFSAFIANLGKYVEGSLVGQWVEFPKTDDRIREVLEEIGIDGDRCEEIFIADYDCNINGLYDKLGESENLSMLNYLAKKIQEGDTDFLEAALESGACTGSARDIINVLDNQDCFLFFHGIENDYDLGYYYIHEAFSESELSDRLGELAGYIDYEAYGRDIQISEGGCYTGNGCYICLMETITDYVEGVDDIPYEYLLCSC